MEALGGVLKKELIQMAKDLYKTRKNKYKNMEERSAFHEGYMSGLEFSMKLINKKEPKSKQWKH
jgi:hypothetical protein